MIALNHSFVEGIAHRAAEQARAALALIELVRRRTRALPLVHDTLASFDTGQGTLIAWANRMRRDRDRWPVVELLLRLVSGPFVHGDRHEGLVTPPIDELPEWLEDIVRVLLRVQPAPLVGLLSPAPTGGADGASFESGGRVISNWRDPASFDSAVIAVPAGRSTIEVLREAEGQMAGQLVVLPSAVRSAEAWELDCKPADLLRALLGLEAYAAALGERLGREQCAGRYLAHTGIEMSRESGEVSRKPTRRKEREFVAGDEGKQFFDMHAKPGNLTRVHVWVSTSRVQPLIYVGHCGRHLT